MSLSPGTRLGPYEIQSQLGAGGMGEVYKARDTRLERIVAIKVLLAHVADDPDLRQRFEREAKTISSLNHPHICTLYDIGHVPRSGVGRGGPTSEAAARGAGVPAGDEGGVGRGGPTSEAASRGAAAFARGFGGPTKLEERSLGVPASDEAGIDFLVMEYLEGETLAARLTKGPLPTDQVLRYATEIADALDKAHRKGITHRDLKPGNIMITKAGTKLLDFGLAKLRDPKTTGLSVSQRPTESAGLTGEGKILGTLQYMAPEQLEGKEADHRTDIFAFGALVYEMATGKKAFEGKSQASLIGAILEREPVPISSLQPVSPPALDQIVKTCLAKDPDDRWQTVGDVGRQVKWIIEGGSQVGVPAGVATSRKARPLLVGAVAGAVIAAILTGLAAWSLTRSGPSAPRRPMRSAIILPPSDQLLFWYGEPSFALSPDGQTLVYAASRDGVSQLYRRNLDQLEAVPIPGTEEGQGPFFSPDGASIGFVVAGAIRKLTLGGGPPVTVYDQQRVVAASWGEDDTIVFDHHSDGTSLTQVPATGGAAQPVTSRTLDEGETYHGMPELLPGGRALLFTVFYGTGPARVAVQSLETGARRALVEGIGPRYATSGHIVFSRSRSLWAVPFDLDQLETTGPAVPLVEDVRGFALAGNGTLVYVPAGEATAGTHTLVWVDREGLEEAVAAEPDFYNAPRLSPDGTSVALVVGSLGTNQDIWIYDFTRDRPTRLTFDSGVDSFPLWTRDGQRVVFSSGREGIRNVFWRAADGTGPVERLTSSPNLQSPWTWSDDGMTLVLQEQRPETGWDLTMFSIESNGSSDVLIQTGGIDLYPAISPNGRWIAYSSDESGQFEVYVRPFPNADDARWQITTAGGRQPIWGPDGSELFYITTAADGLGMMIVSTDTEATFGYENPELLFQGDYVFPGGSLTYDVSPDGRFLMMKEAATRNETPTRPQLIVVLNWFEELKARVPTGR